MEKKKDKMNLSITRAKRKELRNHSTSAEATLWRILKGKQIGGLKFRRQHSVGSYILDFYCPEIQLAIELDGQVHYTFQAMEYDQNRTDYIFQIAGITILRFENKVVFSYPESIRESILDYKNKR
ncbi:MAG: endonuclease domain-containing protein [Mediterranea sp.]|jgi:very-short-patch-repair endonuclease|nr:endonuclease domain-containing protein [Mediterranea sp.]